MRFSLMLLLISFGAYGQSDSTVVQASLKKAEQFYTQFAWKQAAIYSGSYYQPKEHPEDDFPFHGKSDWQDGNIEFNGQRYTNIPLLYDLTLDELITEHYPSAREIVMTKTKIASFTLGETRFINLTATADNLLPQSGYYELLYDGPSMVVVRHKKTREEKIVNNQLDVYYTYRLRMYIFKDGKSYRVATRGDLLKVFGDRKAELRAYIRDKQIKLLKENHAAFAAVAAHYDLIKGSKK